MRKGAAVLAYIKKVTVAGNQIRVEKYYSSRYGSKGKCTRSQNFGKTPEATAKRNSRYAQIKADDIFNANFSKGDLTITFTFEKGKRPKSTGELKQMWQKYIRQVRTAYKKAGVPFKWMKGIDATESNPHIHAAFTYIDLRLLPKWEYGKIHINPVDDREYHTFGSYTVKQGIEKEGGAKKLDGERLIAYSHSRNCIIPEPEITVISNDHWAEEPKAPKGYYVVKDSLQNWEDEVNGYKHQSYILCALPLFYGKRKRPKSINKIRR